MNNPEYKEKLLNANIPDIQYVLDVLSETDWYFSDNKEKEVFAQNCFLLIHENFDSIKKDDLINIMDRLCHFDINDEDLAKKLMKKSIEFGVTLFTPYYVNFNIFNDDEKIAYVKILNNTNDDDFYFFNLKLSKINSELLFDIYKNYYYSDKNEFGNKEIPCENFNLFVLESKPSLFFKNMLIDENEKIRILKKSLNKENSSPNFWSIFNAIKNNEIEPIELGLIEPITYKLAHPQSTYNKKNNIIDFFDVINKGTKELIDHTTNIILNSPEIKKGLISILKEKIKLPVDYDIKNFNNTTKNYRNINLLQYLIFNKSNSFLIISLCKKDKEFMGLFNNVLLERVEEFDYERHPLDLALKGDILTSSIEDLYIYKTINNELNPRVKDKICAMFFKSISRCVASDPVYKSLLNAVSLMPTNLVNKYFNRYKEILSEKKHDDLETIKNMLNLNKSLTTKNSSEIIKPKLKI